MQKNTKNKAFIYLLLLCLLYVGGQQRVWGQDKFRTIYSWGTAIADTTPKRILKDGGLSQIVEPQLPIIQKQERDRKMAFFRSYTFYIDRPLSESVTLENLFTDYAFLLPPIYATDSLVLTDTIYNEHAYFRDLIAKKQFNNNGVTYRYQQYHKGYKANGMNISLIDGKIYRFNCNLPNLDVDVTNVISIDEALGKALDILDTKSISKFAPDMVKYLADIFQQKLKTDTRLTSCYTDTTYISEKELITIFLIYKDPYKLYKVKVNRNNGTATRIDDRNE